MHQLEFLSVVLYRANYSNSHCFSKLLNVSCNANQVQKKSHKHTLMLIEIATLRWMSYKENQFYKKRSYVQGNVGYFITFKNKKKKKRKK